MNDELLRAAGDEPERGTELLGAIEHLLYGMCSLVAKQLSPRRPTKLSRDDLLVLVKDAETARIMAAEGAEYHEAYQKAHDRFDEDPALGVRRAEGYVEAWKRRADDRYRRRHR